MSNKFGDLCETRGWQLVYRKMRHSTRQAGLHTCCNATIGSWIVLKSLKEQLITDNYRSINEDDTNDDNNDDIVNEFESTLKEEDKKLWYYEHKKMKERQIVKPKNWNNRC